MTDDRVEQAAEALALLVEDASYHEWIRDTVERSGGVLAPHDVERLTIRCGLMSPALDRVTGFLLTLLQERGLAITVDDVNRYVAQRQAALLQGTTRQ